MKYNTFFIILFMVFGSIFGFTVGAAIFTETEYMDNYGTTCKVREVAPQCSPTMKFSCYTRCDNFVKGTKDSAYNYKICLVRSCGCRWGCPDIKINEEMD
jgi:hypothetical protein